MSKKSKKKKKKAAKQTKPTSAPAASESDLRTKLDANALWVILGLAVLLRIILLPRESLWFDEAATTAYLAEPTFFEFVQALRRLNPDVPPVYLWIEYQWAHNISDSHTSLRILSLIPALFSIVLAYKLIDRLHSRQAALITSYLMAVSSTHIYYSLEIRMYSMLIVLLLFSIYSYFRTIEHGSRLWWAAHIATTIAIIYTHQLGILILPCLAAHAWFYGFPDKRTKVIWAGLHTLTVATFIPYFLVHEREGFGEIYNSFKPPLLYADRFDPNEPSLYHTIFMWMTPPGHWNNWESTYQWLGTIGRTLLGLGNTLAIIIYLGSLGFFTRHTVSAIRKHGLKSENAGRLIFWAVLFTAPILFLFIVSQVWRPIFMSRYLLLQMIAMFVCVSIAIANLSNKKQRTALIAALVCATLLQVLVDVRHPHRGSWTALAEEAQTDRHPNPKLHIYATERSDLEYADQYLKWNVNDPGVRIIPYLSFNDLDIYLLRSYATPSLRVSTQYYGDMIIAVDAKARNDVIRYLDQHDIRYAIEPKPGRDYHHIIRLHPASPQ